MVNNEPIILLGIGVKDEATISPLPASAWELSGETYGISALDEASSHKFDCYVGLCFDMASPTGGIASPIGLCLWDEKA